RVSRSDCPGSARGCRGQPLDDEFLGGRFCHRDRTMKREFAEETGDGPNQRALCPRRGVLGFQAWRRTVSLLRRPYGRRRRWLVLCWVAERPAAWGEKFRRS